MADEKIEGYEQAIEYILSIPKFTKKNDMEKTAHFLQKLGNPCGNRKIIHIAGTNGKGSVCAYLCKILQTAGYHVGMFTSPHLVDIRERFRIDGKMVDKEEFLKVFFVVYHKVMEEKEDEFEGYHPTFFEFLFFMGMLLFEDKKCEYILLETGLGGRLDATNSVPKKELSLITKISLDHTEYLGNTIAQIAAEKAGIIGEGVPVLYIEECEETDRVICNHAKKHHAPAFFVAKKDYHFLKFHNKNIDFSYHSRYYGYITLTVSSSATYQMENVALAVGAAEILLEKEQMPSKLQLQKAVIDTKWEGRMEEVLPDVFVDGAHNEDGIAQFLDSVKHFGKSEKTLLFSVVKEKNYCKMIEELVKSGLFGKIVITHLDNSRAVEMLELTEVFQQYKQLQVVVNADVENAFQMILQAKKEDEQIFVAGSLYLVGRIKEILRRNQDD